MYIKKDNINFPHFFLKSGESFKKFLNISFYTGCSSKQGLNNIEAEFKNHVHFYKGINLIFDEDDDFTNQFVLDVDDKENTKIFFNDNIKNIFKEKSNPEYVYGGNGDYFIVSNTKELSFENTIKFFEENLRLFTELTY